MDNKYFEVAENYYSEDDISTAIQYYELALEMGDIRAAYELALIYKDLNDYYDISKYLKYIKMGLEFDDKCQKEYTNYLIDSNDEFFLDGLETIFHINKYNDDILLNRIKNIGKEKIRNISKYIEILEQSYNLARPKIRINFSDCIVPLYRTYFEQKINHSLSIEELMTVLNEIKNVCSQKRYERIKDFIFLQDRTKEKIDNFYYNVINTTDRIIEFKEKIISINNSCKIELIDLYSDFIYKIISENSKSRYDKLLEDLVYIKDSHVDSAFASVIDRIEKEYSKKITRAQVSSEFIKIIKEIESSVISQELQEVKKQCISKLEQFYERKIDIANTLEDCDLLLKNLDNEYIDITKITKKILDKKEKIESKSKYIYLEEQLKKMTNISDYPNIKSKINGFPDELKQKLLIKLHYKMFTLYVDENMSHDLYDYNNAYNYMKCIPVNSNEYKICKDKLSNIISKKEIFKYAWQNYDDEFSNFIYCAKYYPTYEKYDDAFIKYIFDNFLNVYQERIKLLFLGCGNYKEISVSLKYLLSHNCHNKIIEITIIDQCKWQYNFYNEVDRLLKEFKVTPIINFIKSDFFEVLNSDNDECCNFDIVYFSRCINQIEQRNNCIGNNYFDKISNIINRFRNNVVAFSQVVNNGNVNACIKENEFLEYLRKYYHINSYKFTLKNGANVMSMDKISQINFNQNEYLSFYLYIKLDKKNQE